MVFLFLLATFVASIAVLAILYFLERDTKSFVPVRLRDR